MSELNDFSVTFIPRRLQLEKARQRSAEKPRVGHRSRVSRRSWVSGRGTARLLVITTVLTLSATMGTTLDSRVLGAAPAFGRLVPAGTMTVARGGQTATLLPDGRVLLVGGQVDGEDQSTAELYDPATDSFTRTGSISTLWRMAPAAVLLPDGRVLLVGGFGQQPGSEDVTAFEFAEVYDPRSGQFSRTGPMIVPRQWLWSALALQDGRVLIAGGEGPNGILGSIELFDPVAGAFVPGGVMISPRTQHTMTLLPDGKVLIAGGWGTDGPLATAEIYDPKTGTSVATGSLGTARSGATATALADGRVLIVGGTGPGTTYGDALASAELYDPTSGTFRPTGRLVTERSGASAVPLRDGRVLVAGGYNIDGSPRTVERYDPASGRFEVVGKLGPGSTSGNSNWLSETLLRDGSVLIAGRDIAAAERYDPSLPAEPAQPAAAPVVPVGFQAVEGPGALRTGHTATRLADGRILIVGGTDGGTGPVLASAEIYDPATGRSTPTGSMAVPRSGHVAALLDDGRVLIAGGLGGADITTSWPSAEIYDPISGSFSPAGPVTVAKVRTPGPHASSGEAGSAAVTLRDGRVLIFGWDPTSTEGAPSMETYDPATRRFTTKAASAGSGAIRSATLLPDGRVLVLTGTHFEPTVQATVYDPVADTWDPAGQTVAGQEFSATGLPDGRVLVAGGVSYHSDDGTMAAARIWDPVTGTFSATGDMMAARAGHAGTLLPDGSVLVTGGYYYSDGQGTQQDGPLAPELWDPRSGAFSPAGTMAAQRTGHTATAFDDGRVLLVGGVTRSPDRTDPVPPFAEVYVGP